MNKVIAFILLSIAGLMSSNTHAVDCSGLAQYSDSASYATGAKVQSSSKAYECKVGGWCTFGGPYAPPDGWAWTFTWTDLGPCNGGGSSGGSSSGGSSSGGTSSGGSSSGGSSSGGEACRPDGLYTTPGVDVPYCSVYDTNGREKMAIPRRIIGYFPSWRLGADNTPRYLVKDIPWDKITHINYAFAHVENNQVSIGDANDPNNPATGLTWPGVAGAEMDPAYSFNGHFNLFNKLKKQYPQVKTMVSVGGWAETGGHFANGTRVNDGGFYTMSDSEASMTTFANSAVTFLRTYGFDGIDIDYEYATSMPNAGNPLDFTYSNARRASLMSRYVTLMKLLREKLDAASAQDGKHYLLTVAAPSSGYMLRGMDMYQVTEYLDYLNIMSYDLHGAWNEFVGPNAALYDNGQDSELAHWSFYGVYEIGYLNTDWAYHYFRGNMPAGRLNIGVPYYTRGWKGVSGGTNGLWGKAPLPNQSECPAGTGGTVGSTVPCGAGATGIDNIWHDVENQAEVPAGANPMWHAKNLERGIAGSYLASYGVTEGIEGTYQRFYDSTMVTPWLWNSTRQVFLSTEDEQSLNVKADYVVSKGIGGIMFWELSGDYDCPQSGECGIGDTLTSTLHSKFANASAYGATRAERTMPTQTLNISYSLGGYPVGDSNFPITGKLTFTNNDTVTIPGGAVFEFNYPTSDIGTLSDQSGMGTSTVQDGHAGNNIGAPGLDSNYHLARITLPSWQSLAPGASVTITFAQQLPTGMFSNWTVAFGGTTYGVAFDHARGTSPGGSSSGGSSSGGSSSGGSSSGGSSSGGSGGGGCAGIPVWDAGAVYNGGDQVQENGIKYQAKWWTQGASPAANSSQWAVWSNLGSC